MSNGKPMLAAQPCGVMFQSALLQGLVMHHPNAEEGS